MKLLILTVDYPRLDGTHERMFVHVRNLFYKKQGIDVTVLNFACDNEYYMDDIRVITLKQYKEERKKVEYDIAVSHASNLRNHYLFLKKYDNDFSHLVFFFHGHEVLYLNQDYPKPYTYVLKNKLRNGIFQDIYDCTKIWLWRNYYKKKAYKSEYVFVSNWILNKFFLNTGLSRADLLNHVSIINNSIGAAFENRSWNFTCQKKYDFITIRSIMDGSKYCIDLIVELAEKNPTAKFLIIGRGKYFDYNNKPENIDWIDHTLNHEEMFDYLDLSRCGLLLTREDTQGVMTCELAAYGMPVITSNIEVCHEFFDSMPNVALISNEDMNINIMQILDTIQNNAPYVKDTTYFGEKKITQEISLFEKIVR